jgi:adenylate cyclase
MIADPGGQSVAVLPDHGRMLIAVVYVDMAGYSRLIGLDDAGTIERLRTLRRDLIDPGLARHGGTLVSTGGDSLLITFNSIVPAVRFAVDMQRGVPDFDGDCMPDRRIRFRVGVNVGDVIPDGTNLHGDGVNVAARLQSVCPPGAICVSRIVRDHVGERLGLNFMELGAIGLKNIARPTEAFLLALGSPVAGSPRDKRPRRRAAWVGAALSRMGVLIVGKPTQGGEQLYLAEPRSRSPGKRAPPPRLSLAILPFSNVGGSAELARLADGIVDDLTTDLAQLSDALVTSRQNALRFKDQPVNALTVGQVLNVRHVLTGSLRRVGSAVRVNVALLSGETDATLWVDQLSVRMAVEAEDQGEIASWLRNSVIRQLVHIEAARSVRERPDNPDALDLILQARGTIYDPPSRNRTMRAQALYEEALRLDPASVPAMTGLAATIIFRHVRLGENLSGTDLDRVRALTAAAEALTPTGPHVLWTRAMLVRLEERWLEATAAFEHLLSFYPHFDAAVEMLGVCRIQLGRSEDAIPLYQKLIRDDPHTPSVWVRYHRLGMALLFVGRFAEAAQWFQRSLAAEPEQSASVLSLGHLLIAGALTLGGHVDRAREEIVAAKALYPYATVRSFMAWYVADEVFEAQIMSVREALRLAGLRDHVDEGEDFGIVPDSLLRTDVIGKTPLTVPGAITIQTPELAAFRRDGEPLVIDASKGNRTLAGAIRLYEAGLGGTLEDSLQDRLSAFMQTLTGGNLSRPIVTLGMNAERWTGYNLAVRLVALGYCQVYWYRGGREAWEAAGLPIDRAPVVALPGND